MVARVNQFCFSLSVVCAGLIGLSGSQLCAQTTITKDSLEAYKLTGPVKQVLYAAFEATIVEDSFSIGTQINSIAWPSKLTFRKDGCRLTRSECNMDGKECRHWIDEYDSAGRVMSQRTIEDDVVVWDKKDYFRTPNGQLGGMAHYMREPEGLALNHTRKFAYDEQGRIVEEKKFDENGVFKSKYLYSYEANQSTWHHYKQVDDEGNVEKTETRTVDDRGRVIQLTQTADGLPLEMINYTYDKDSLIAKEIFIYLGGNYVLTEAKRITHAKDGQSVFTLIKQDAKLEIARYKWEIKNSSGLVTCRQRCKYGVLTTENKYEYDSLGQLTTKERFDYEDGDEARTEYEYHSGGRSVVENTVTKSGGEDLIKRYYDEYGNWIYILESKSRPGDIKTTRVHKRVIEYYE